MDEGAQRQRLGQCAGEEDILGIAPEPLEVDHARADADKDQEEMPRPGMHGQGRQRIHKAACIRKHSDTAKEAEAHQEGEEHPADALPAQPRVGEQQIHGDTAKLEWEIPPVICPVPQGKSQDKLLPDLAAQHKHAAQEKHPVRPTGKIQSHQRRLLTHLKHLFYIIPRAQKRKRRASGIYFSSRGSRYNPRGSGAKRWNRFGLHGCVIIIPQILPVLYGFPSF